MDDNIVYATAQSKQLPVDLGAGAYRGGRPSTACLLHEAVNILSSRSSEFSYGTHLSASLKPNPFQNTDLDLQKATFIRTKK